MNLELLENGMRWWIEKKSRWGNDFLNSFYQRLYSTRPSHLNKDWWCSIVDILGAWRAIRSPKPPNTKKEIYTRGLERLEALNEQYQHIQQQSSGREPTLDNVTWEDIAPLFDVLCQIKGGVSPVFPSKLGHFIFPCTFIIIDNEATAVFPYEFMWRVLQIAWQKFTEKEKAKQMLIKEIQKCTTNIHPKYPFETKIAEMWLIGYKHR